MPALVEIVSLLRVNYIAKERKLAKQYPVDLFAIVDIYHVCPAKFEVVLKFLKHNGLRLPNSRFNFPSPVR